MKRKEFGPKYLTIIVVSVMVIIQIIYALTSSRFGLRFGVEYGNIAMSMLSGDGFGNPFYPSLTGPTAWMPPFLVYLIYWSFSVFGAYSAGAFIFLTILKIASYGLTFYFLCRVLQVTRIPLYPLFLIILYLLYFMFSPSDNLSNIHDFWIIQLLIILFIYSTLRIHYGNKRYLILLGIVIFVAPFNNPGFSLAFLFTAVLQLYLLPTISLVRQKRKLMARDIFRPELVHVVSISLLFALSVSIWTIRNYETFGRFIPTKSNMWFEFYLSNIVDSDGQLSQSTTYRAHPIYNKNLRSEMLQEGEAEWLMKFEPIGKEFLSSNTSHYFENLATRLFNAFVFIENDNDKIYSSAHDLLKPSDKRKLEAKKWLVKDFWLSLSYKKEEFRQLLEEADIEDVDLVYEDWYEARQTYLRKKKSFRNIVRSLFMALVPSLSILLLIITRRFRQNPAVFLSISLYLVYLLPYLLISHQIRYQRPLFVIQVLLVYTAFIWIVEKLPEKYTRVLKSGIV